MAKETKPGLGLLVTLLNQCSCKSTLLNIICVKWCMSVPGFAGCSISPSPCRRWLVCRYPYSHPGRAQGGGRAGYPPEPGSVAQHPPWLHRQFALGPLTTERGLGDFRQLTLHWWCPQTSLLENTRGSHSIPSEPGAFIPSENWALGIYQIPKLETSARNPDFYCSQPQTSMATYLTVISQQSLELHQIQLRSHSASLVLVLKWGWWYLLPKPPVNKNTCLAIA